MFAYLTRLQRNRKGFTLIELMVVVVILGILAGAAIMTLGGDQAQDADRARVKSDISTIVSALEFYALENDNTYPTTEEGLAQLVTDGFLKAVPAQPDGTVYTYVSPGASAENYTLTSAVTNETGNAISDANLAEL